MQDNSQTRVDRRTAPRAPRGDRDRTADHETIVAVSTPPGKGGIGVVRLSGPAAASISGGLFRAAAAVNGRPGAAVFGRFVDRQGEPIDHGYRILFEPSRSFSGEATAELWAHGSPAVLRCLVEEAVALGARPATPGEFSMRAFLNGRIDATQAEAIRDLIEARTLYQARIAHHQVMGRISSAVNLLKDRLADVIARIEASIEFSEEEEAGRFVPEGGVMPELRRLREAIVALAGSYDRGRRVREGATVALIGAPNVGKSSLFNRLLEEERAIVTSIAGTTRDRIEESLEVRGIPVVLVDTAGIHEPRNEADAAAVARARTVLNEADLLLLVLDRSRPLEAADIMLMGETGGGRCIIVLNKNDLPSCIDLDRIDPARRSGTVLEISARTGDGIGRLRELLTEAMTGGIALSVDETFLTNVRHRDLLVKAAGALSHGEAAARDRMGDECLALDLKDALDRLGEIGGEIGIEGIYERIFSRFCIGK